MADDYFWAGRGLQGIEFAYENYFKLINKTTTVLIFIFKYV